MAASKLEDLFKEPEEKKATDATPPQVDDPFAGITSDQAPPEEADEFFAGNDGGEEFSEDFTGETAGSRLAEEGLHEIRVTNIEKGKSQRGDPMYIWDFVINRGESAGITLKLFTSLAPQARWKVIETLEGLGIDASNRKVTFKKSDVVGKIAWATIVHDTYKGREQNVVQKVMTESDAAELVEKTTRTN